MAKPGLLHVRTHLERVHRTCIQMLADANKHENGLRLPPIYIEELASIRLMTNAILLKHERKNTRKDIRVEV